VNFWSLPLSFIRFLKILYRVRALDTRRDSIQIVRWQSEKPARMQGHKSFSLFYRPQFFKGILLSVFLGAIVIWTIKNYIELVAHF
jgi:hypothetical protein